MWGNLLEYAPIRRQLSRHLVEPHIAPTSGPDRNRLARLRRLSWWLDEGIRVPGTRFRIGLDPVLGLVPGLGDTAGALMSAAILVEAVRHKVPRLTLVRMAVNVILDTSVGSIPLVGDIFDAVWKSNTRNLQLLERHSNEPLAAQRADRLVVGSLFGILFLLCVGLLLGFAFLTAAVLKYLVGL